MQESQASWQTSATLRRIRSLLLANLVEEKAAHPSARSQSQLQSQSAARAASQQAGAPDERALHRYREVVAAFAAMRRVAEEAQGKRQKGEIDPPPRPYPAAATALAGCTRAVKSSISLRVMSPMANL